MAMIDIDKCCTAEEFVRWLRISNWGKDPRRWVFRGVKDASYKLVPSALRFGCWLPVGHGKWTDAPIKSNWEQCDAEYRLVQRFYRMADAQALAVPNDSPALREALAPERFDSSQFSETQWPPRELVWLLVACQHYVVPTRLLDWSRNPLVAAWFAAHGAAKALDETTGQKVNSGNPRLVVWALKRRAAIKAPGGLRIESGPRNLLPNLHLQSGMGAVPDLHSENKAISVT